MWKQCIHCTKITTLQNQCLFITIFSVLSWGLTPLCINNFWYVWLKSLCSSFIRDDRCWSVSLVHWEMFDDFIKENNCLHIGRTEHCHNPCGKLPKVFKLLRKVWKELYNRFCKSLQCSLCRLQVCMLDMPALTHISGTYQKYIIKDNILKNIWILFYLEENCSSLV